MHSNCSIAVSNITMESSFYLQQPKAAPPFSLSGLLFPLLNAYKGKPYEGEPHFRNSEEASEKKSHELNESIRYAKRIQDALMLKEKHLTRLFPESFLLFQPKAIVSGDFYWFTRINNRIIVAVADATGHGIPGAFMSVLGISLLNQIILEEQQTDTSLILQRLDHKLKKAFGYSPEQHNDQHPDGMDIAICSIDTDNRTIQFSGAFRPLYLLKASGMHVIKGSRYPIGGMNLEPQRHYASQEIAFEPGMRMYLCSDGYADQFGGNQNKKLMTAKFRELLVKTAHYSMNTQQNELLRHLNEWKSNQEQTDDILILGVQLP